MISLDTQDLIANSGRIYVQTPPERKGTYRAAIVLNDSIIIREVFVNYENGKVQVVLEKNQEWRPLRKGISAIYFERSHERIDYGKQDKASKWNPDD